MSTKKRAQKGEDRKRGQKIEDRKERTEKRGQTREGRKERTEKRRQKTECREQKRDDRDRENINLEGERGSWNVEGASEGGKEGGEVKMSIRKWWSERYHESNGLSILVQENEQGKGDRSRKISGGSLVQS